MGAIATLSDLVNRCTGGGSGTPQQLSQNKDGRVGAAAAAATIAGRYTDLWEYNGSPSHGAVPGAVAIPDNTTDGGIKQTDPGVGRQLWLLGGHFASLAPGTVTLYDRLLHIGGFSGTVTTAQNVGGAITRYTGALSVSNEIWVPIFTQIGATPTTITASYTDQGGAAATTQATAIGGTGLREAQRIIRLPLALGDTGVRGVTSVTLAGTTGTAGNFGVIIAHPLLTIPIGQAGVGSIRNLITSTGPVEIMTDACLSWLWLAQGTSPPHADAMLSFVEA